MLFSLFFLNLLFRNDNSSKKVGLNTSSLNNVFNKYSRTSPPPLVTSWCSSCISKVFGPNILGSFSSSIFFYWIGIGSGRRVLLSKFTNDVHCAILCNHVRFRITLLNLESMKSLHESLEETLSDSNQCAANKSIFNCKNFNYDPHGPNVLCVFYQ